MNSEKIIEEANIKAKQIADSSFEAKQQVIIIYDVKIDK